MWPGLETRLRKTKRAYSPEPGRQTSCSHHHHHLLLLIFHRERERENGRAFGGNPNPTTKALRGNWSPFGCESKSLSFLHSLPLHENHRNPETIHPVAASQIRSHTVKRVPHKDSLRLQRRGGGFWVRRTALRWRCRPSEQRCWSCLHSQWVPARSEDSFPPRNVSGTLA